MNYDRALAHFRNIEDHPAIKLIASNKMAFVMSFLTHVFSDASEVEYHEFLRRLEAVLKTEQFKFGTQSQEELSAKYFFDYWIRNRWIRELDGKVIKTQVFESVSAFAKSLDSSARISGVTSNQLNLVHSVIREYYSKLTATSEQREKLLEAQIKELKAELSAVRRGEYQPLTDRERREGIQDIHTQAEVLTRDFRMLEEKIVQNDEELRRRIAIEDHNRSDVLELAMNLEDELFDNTDEGASFRAFYDLLRDFKRQEEIDTLLTEILSDPQSQKHLTLDQSKYLKHFVRVLTNRSEQVRLVRKRTTERLRDFMTAYREFDEGAINDVLTQMERVAIGLKENHGDVSRPDFSGVPVRGTSVKIKTRDPIRLHVVTTPMSSDLVEHATSEELSDSAVKGLSTLQVRRIAEGVREVLISTGRSMTLSEITECRPVTAGVEEIIALVRVASAANALDGGTDETITFEEDGKTLTASLPVFLLHASAFPENIEDMRL